MRLPLFFLSVTALFAAPGLAQERFPLGPLGGAAEVRAGSAAAVIVALDADGPAARAGIAVGDALVGVAERVFDVHSANIDEGGSGPQRALGLALDAAAATAPNGETTLGLLVTRGSKRESIEVALPPRSPLAGADATGRRFLRAAAARQLLAAQRPEGHWDAPVGLTGDRVLTAWALVALLADGDPAQAEARSRAAAWLRGPEGRAWLPEDFSKGPDNLGNWALTATSIALGEHHLDTGDEADLPVVRRCNAALVARMTPAGLFGHDLQPGYGGKGFNVINSLAHLAWAYGELLEIPVEAAAWDASFQQVTSSIDPNGGVRYWTLPGTGTGDASLRTASMALSLSLTGRAPEVQRRLARYLDAHASRAREAHAVGSLGMLVQAPALFAHEREAYGRFIEEWRWYLVLTLGPDRRLRYIGGKGNNGGDSYLGFDLVACVIALQLTACEDGALRMHHAAPAEAGHGTTAKDSGFVSGAGG